MTGNHYTSAIIEKLSRVDRGLLAVIFVIFFTGIAMLYSIGNGSMRPWALKQLMYFLLCLPLCFSIATIDINFWLRNAYSIYAIGLIMLIVVEIAGYRSMGATRWLNLGFVRIQPSEFMKICIILAMARYFFQTDLKNIRNNSTLLIPLLMVGIPCILILRQPNLGTALILATIGVSILFFVGVQIKKFILCFALVLMAVPLVWKFGLHDYQKQRILIFLDPESDPLNSGYNIAQSKIAIGSGGLWGKGFIKGTQGQLEFLPERHTDFIFTVFCEEFGFIGSISIVCLYIIMFSIFVYIIIRCNNTFGKIIVGGVFVNFFSHFFINIGMVTGILPVVGTPLILFSYGGSVTVSSMISIGFVLNIQVHLNREVTILV
ncbi:MAG: rod shape-determining protein RodA [Rickettsiales bacterium]|jgi:rod shape determining protein RodA|nr:rod shape-determining protein RodA [Rickettsiales bacterium]